MICYTDYGDEDHEKLTCVCEHLLPQGSLAIHLFKGWGGGVATSDSCSLQSRRLGKDQLWSVSPPVSARLDLPTCPDLLLAADPYLSWCQRLSQASEG